MAALADGGFARWQLWAVAASKRRVGRAWHLHGMPGLVACVSFCTYCMHSYELTQSMLRFYYGTCSLPKKKGQKTARERCPCRRDAPSCDAKASSVKLERLLRFTIKVFPRASPLGHGDVRDAEGQAQRSLGLPKLDLAQAH